MDSGTIFYIIAIIIYFIYTSFIQKKAEKPTSETEDSEAKPPKQGPSFDDLLREIRNEQGQRERDLEESPEAREVETSEKYPAKEAEVVDYETNPQEEYKNPYQDLKQPLVKLDDQVDLGDDKRILGEVEDVAAENPGNSKYARLLKNPASARDAVILTEIFNRRHF